ncbi:hypothetical protein PR003_g28923, partial [Phytophthora rubi]
MKSPTNYGSENEETRFIRRVAAPDRPNNKRRQKKRLAVAGATIGLLAASAGVCYATMRASSGPSDIKSAKLAANMANDAFVSKLGDAFHPKFDEIDTDQNGELSKDEILADLNGKETVDVKRVMKSDLPDDIKGNLVALLEGKLQSDSDCAKQALDSRPSAVRREDHEIFYYMLDVFCPRVTIAVTPPDQEAASAAAPADSQQTVEIPTPDGGTAQVLIIGEPEDGKQTIAIPDDQGGYTTTEVKSIETPTGEQKILIPNADGDITPVVVPELPADVTADLSEDAQVVDVVTPSGETEQVIVEGEPEHGEQTVKIPDNDGGYIETKAEVVETPTGEEQLIVPTADGDIIQVPVPEPLPDLDSGPNPYANQEPVVQTVDVVADDGEHEQVIVVGEVEDGKQTIEVANDQGGYTEKEVIAVETDQGESIVVPDGNGGTTVVNVPDVPDVIADLATDDTQVVNVVNPDNGAQQQIVIEGEPEHGEVTVDIVDESGEVTTEQVKVVETDDGLKLEVPTDDGIVPVVVPDVPAKIQEEIAEEENPVPPVLQTVDVVTPSGEEKQVIIEGEPDHGVQTVEIPNEHGDYVETQVKAVETDDGVKLAIPDSNGETTVVTVPDVPAAVVQQASDDTLVLNIESPSGELQQVIIDGKPENGVQTVQIVDEHGAVTTEDVKTTETSEGEKIVVLTDGGYIPVTIPEVPTEAKEEIAQQQAEAGIETPSTEEETPVAQTIDVVADNGEHQQVILVGDIEDGTQTIEVANDFGGYTETEVKAVETSEGEKLVVPDAEGDATVVVVPEVPAEIAEIATEDTQVVNVVTASGEQQQVVIEGEPEHGEVT